MLPDALPAAAAALAAVAIVVTFVADRVRARRFHEITRAAVAVANQQLPAMIDSIRTADEDAAYLSASLRPLPVPPGGDVARLTAAFNTVQAMAVDLAIAERVADARGRRRRRHRPRPPQRGVGGVELNVLDQLEATERDPERLARLVELDHLAARLRRNTETLLSVAGEEVTRTRGRSVAVRDLVRAAIGEAENYRNIRVTDLEAAELAGAAAADVAHVLAELLDNATHSGGVVVDVHGRREQPGLHALGGRPRARDDRRAGRRRERRARPPAGRRRPDERRGRVPGRRADRGPSRVEGAAGRRARPGVVALVSIPKALLGALPDAPAAAPADEDEDWAEGWVDAPLPSEPLTYSEMVAGDDLDGILAEAFGDGPVEPERDLDADPDPDSDWVDDERPLVPTAASRPPLNTHHFDAGLARLIAAAKDRTR